MSKLLVLTTAAGLLAATAASKPAAATDPKAPQAPSAAEARRLIPGYRHGDPGLPRSPVTPEQFENLKTSLLFTEEDVRYLRLAGEVMVPQTEAILDVWYGFVGSNPHLVHYFSDRRTGQPDAQYLSRVRQRFGRWIKDTTDANYDQAWLDYQHEIGLRHTRLKKNLTDGANSVPEVHQSHITAFIVPVSATVKPFLEKSERSPEDVAKMHAAWTKSVTLQTILWSHPYVKEGQF